MSGHDLLLEEDREYLDSKEFGYEVTQEPGGLLLVVHGFELP